MIVTVIVICRLDQPYHKQEMRISSCRVLVSLHAKSPKAASRAAQSNSLRDRLRAVECSSDIVDAIEGWKTSGIVHRYGNGY